MVWILHATCRNAQMQSVELSQSGEDNYETFLHALQHLGSHFTGGDEVAEQGQLEASQMKLLEGDEFQIFVLASTLAYGTPEEFNLSFHRIASSSRQRANIVSQHLVADAIPFPLSQLEQSFPQIANMTEMLSAKAGCPFEWAFLLFLPVLSMSCSKARLYINKFFLVPPLLWLGLCLDSGANKFSNCRRHNS